MFQVTEDFFLRDTQDLRKIARDHHPAFQLGYDLSPQGLGSRTVG
jgi:hypothetical protein